MLAGLVGMSKCGMEKAKKKNLYKGKRGENVKERESIRSRGQGAGTCEVGKAKASSSRADAV